MDPGDERTKMQRARALGPLAREVVPGIVIAAFADQLAAFEEDAGHVTYLLSTLDARDVDEQMSLLPENARFAVARELARIGEPIPSGLEEIVVAMTLRPENVRREYLVPVDPLALARAKEWLQCRGEMIDLSRRGRARVIAMEERGRRLFVRLEVCSGELPENAVARSEGGRAMRLHAHYFPGAGEWSRGIRHMSAAHVSGSEPPVVGDVVDVV